MQFKLNSTTNEHPFTYQTSTANDTDFVTDQTYDMVIIKLVGRLDVSSPSKLQFDAVSNYELVFKDNTTSGKLMTPNRAIYANAEILQHANYDLPAVQVA